MGRTFRNRSLRFGIYLPQYAVPFDRVVQVAKEAERLGFDYVWLEDHFVPWYGHSKDSTLECWTVLSALSVTTKRIRIGSLCSCNSYRHPAILAKTVAVVDTSSDGRIQLGIGPGWGALERGIAAGYIEEYEAYGVPFPSPGERVRNLRKSISLIKQVLTGSIEFENKDHSIQRVHVSPRPVQLPNPPVWVCGGGKLMLRLVAEMAGGWNFGPSSPEEYGNKVEALFPHCQEASRDPKLLLKSVKSLLSIGQHKENALEHIQRLRKSFVTKPDLLRSYLNTAVVGDADTCVEQIGRYVDNGAEAFFFIIAGLEKSLEPLNLLGENLSQLC